MNYLAIRDEDCKNVYWFNTKGEKGRILSKFPKASNRVFMEDEMLSAIAWAGVNMIATEEENLWATTKQPIKGNEVDEKPTIEDVPISNEENIVQEEILVPQVEQKEESVSSSIDAPMENKKEEIVTNRVVEEKKESVLAPQENTSVDLPMEEKQVKHIMSDFEKIIEVYKKNGIRLVEITMDNNEKYFLLTDDLYYINNLGENDFGLPINMMNERILRDKILTKVEEDKANGKKGAVFNSYLSFDMFEKLPKTKYLAFGDLVYTNELNRIVELVNEDGKIVYSFSNDETKRNVTFHTSKILSIKPYYNSSCSFIVSMKEFVTYIRKELKRREKEAEKAKEKA